MAAARTEDFEHVFKHCLLARSLWKEILPPDKHQAFLGSDLTMWLILLTCMTEGFMSHGRLDSLLVVGRYGNLEMVESFLIKLIQFTTRGP